MMLNAMINDVWRCLARFHHRNMRRATVPLVDTDQIWLANPPVILVCHLKMDVNRETGGVEIGTTQRFDCQNPDGTGQMLFRLHWIPFVFVQLFVVLVDEICLQCGPPQLC